MTNSCSTGVQEPRSHWVSWFYNRIHQQIRKRENGAELFKKIIRHLATLNSFRSKGKALRDNLYNFLYERLRAKSLTESLNGKWLWWIGIWQSGKWQKVVFPSNISWRLFIPGWEFFFSFLCRSGVKGCLKMQTGLGQDSNPQPYDPQPDAMAFKVCFWE